MPGRRPAAHAPPPVTTMITAATEAGPDTVAAAARQAYDYRKA
ncbi:MULTISPECIES: hypothetical protein [unclassified Streptomyces]|nr:hypothetical protein [Streptomyces sp. TSRI0107]